MTAVHTVKIRNVEIANDKGALVHVDEIFRRAGLEGEP